MRFYQVFRSAALAASTALVVTVASSAALTGPLSNEIDRTLDAALDDLEIAITQHPDQSAARTARSGLAHLAPLLGRPLTPLDPATLTGMTTTAAPVTGPTESGAGSVTDIASVTSLRSRTNRSSRSGSRAASRTSSTRSRRATRAPRTRTAAEGRSPARTSRSSARTSSATRPGATAPPVSAPRPVAPPAVTDGLASAALAFAYRQVGKPYGALAAGPRSFDCSGLTMAAWGAAGVALPHSTTGQYQAVRHISRGELRAGDLVFYYAKLSHVGIYVGNNMIIDAPRSGKRIAVRAIDIMPAVGYGRPLGR